MSNEHEKPPEVGHRVGDTSDLPEELKKLLASEQLDEVEDKIIKTLKKRFGGVANLDELIVGLYREFEYIPATRRGLNNKLYRMKTRDLLESVKGRKGVYRVRE